MSYQTLTSKELKDLLRSRNIAGRSGATTKEKAIVLLEECDRLSAENLPATISPAPVKSFTGNPPVPPAPPEPDSEPDSESEQSNSQPCLSIRQKLVTPIPCRGKLGIFYQNLPLKEPINLGDEHFRLSIPEIEKWLDQECDFHLRRNRGQSCEFVSKITELQCPVDRAAFKFLSSDPGMEFLGRVNCRDVAKNPDVKMLLNSPILNSYYGWNLHTMGITYGRDPWKLCWLSEMFWADGLPPTILEKFLPLLNRELRVKLAHQKFGPLSLAAVPSLRNEKYEEWLQTNDGYWHVRSGIEAFDVFRWWHAAHGWKLDYQKVYRYGYGKICSCEKGDICKHLEIIHKWGQHQEAVKRRKLFDAQQEQHQKETKNLENRRDEILESLRQTNFQKACDIGFQLYRQPFWGLNINQLENIQKEVNNVN